jgi:5,10-methylenetetrahydrofolate reductase
LPADDPAVVERVAAKVEAGAAFLLTQVGYDVDLLGRWLDRLRRRGLTGRVRVLAGVAPIRRPTVARFLRDRVEGAAVPAEVVARIEAAADPEAEGVRLAAAYLRGVRRLPGIAGAHIMTFGWAEGVSRVLAAEAAV